MNSFDRSTARENLPIRVLVVDDELGIREGCRRALTSRGFEVEVAENGPGGLGKLREGSFDVLLVDAMMPGMSGLEMLQHVRKSFPELISIVITGYATVELAVQAIREGAHDFIAKPFTPETLLQVLNRELERMQLKREAQRVKDLEEELRRLARVRAEMEKLGTMESRFMLTMVHILRAPVAVIQNSVQLIRKGYVPPEEQGIFLGRMEQRAGELLAILDDVLILSRLKEGKKSRSDEAVSIADVLDAVLAAYEKEVEAGNLKVSLEVAERPLFFATPEHLRLLWANLMSNAIRYTQPGGQITVSLGGNLEGDKITGTVADTGIGVAPEEISRIFEEFYRTEAAKSLQETGTGLGLAIVQQIVSLYGGSLEVDSAPGRGSSFRFILPRPNSRPGEPA
jgi:two-component system sensor histidine kinase/response regulator